MSAGGSAMRPGEAALQNMKLLKAETTVFKVPKIPKQKSEKKSKVLEEDAYVEVSCAIFLMMFF